MVNNKSNRPVIRWNLVLYDFIVLVVTAFLVLDVASGGSSMGINRIIIHTVIFALIVFLFRFVFQVYSLVWRYGGIQSYVKLMLADFVAFGVYFLIARILKMSEMSQVRMLAFVLADLVLVLWMRMMYRYAYKYGNKDTAVGKLLLFVLHVFAHVDVNNSKRVNRIKVAILGAGHIGVGLADELRSNKESLYEPVCFIDISQKKAGREILGLKVYQEDSSIQSRLTDNNVQQVIITVSNLSNERKVELYERYKAMGFAVMTYDTPMFESAGSRPQLREFSVEELLFRKQQVVVGNKTKAYYNNKVILITGGGGSIGSEICRQLATMAPKQIIILDIYENGAYDVQQELRIKYKNDLKVNVEICSITNIKALERVFEIYKPQIVINAAAHKHVPLMEHNCIEAIENNVFGCQNVIDCCEKYGTKRLMMVSTDKAVNPTNVMGATKRMCEMLVQSASSRSEVVKYSSTRFGNVLGSAGSVIPLFKRQIAAGGPVTITDKRITRYFMTIPEASQLVLVSGAMAKNGDLFVLDMGQPVKILDLAQNMIRIMGAKDIEIIETGLRPGEKLYEELLVKTEKLTKTDNEKIFIEEDTALTKKEIEESLKLLRDACKSGDDEQAKAALHKVVPSFVRPEDINGK